MLISVVPYSEPGRLQPNPEKGAASITEQRTHGPLGSCHFTAVKGWTDYNKPGYISRAAAPACVHCNGCISMCAHKQTHTHTLIHISTICSFLHHFPGYSEDHYDMNAAGVYSRATNSPGGKHNMIENVFLIF